MKIWYYLPIPFLVYLLFQVRWSSESAWLILLGVAIGVNLALITRR